jgi:hypothetical protein
MFPSHLRQKARRRGAQKNSKMLLSGQLLKERPFKKKHKNVCSKQKKLSIGDYKWRLKGLF